MSEHVTISGAGLAGSLMAIYLGRRGFDVDVYEKRPDMRRTDIPAGRSINLALSARGIRALKGVGADNEILDAAIPMHGRMMHAVDGDLSFQPYGQRGQYINSVSRGDLNRILMDRAEANPNVRIHFEHQCQDVDLENGSATFKQRGVRKLVSSDPGYLIGADGAFSAVRTYLQRTDRFTFSQTYLDHGYKELEIPPADDGGFRIEPNALHIWPRHDFMMIALPNPDRTFTCTLFLSFERFETLDSDDAVMRFFEQEFPDAIPHMPNLLEDFRTNPTSSLCYIKCAPYQHGERVMLIGDAAHAVVPFYGQGMNAAFEDCTLFDGLLDRMGDANIGKAMARFSTERKADADAICQLALDNFIEMRSSVANPGFLARKKMEKSLQKVVPGFEPLYSMVTFSNIPYAAAVRRAESQEKVLNAVASGASVAGIAGTLGWLGAKIFDGAKGEE